MRHRKKLAFGTVVLLLAAAAAVPSARTASKPESPLSTYIGQCIVLVTGGLAAGGTVSSVSDHFLQFDNPINDAFPGSPMLVDVNNINVVIPVSADFGTEATGASPARSTSSCPSWV